MFRRSMASCCLVKVWGTKPAEKHQTKQWATASSWRNDLAYFSHTKGLMPGQVWFALMILMMCDVCHVFSAASSFIDSESFFTFFGFLPESWTKPHCHRLELQPLRHKSGANWLLQWHKDIFPDSSCECFFPNNCCQIHLFIFIYTTSPTSFTPPTSSTSSTSNSSTSHTSCTSPPSLLYSLHHLHNLHQLHLHLIHHLHHRKVLNVDTSPTKLLQCHFHKSSWAGVFTQEFFDRRCRTCFTGLVTQWVNF